MSDVNRHLVSLPFVPTGDLPLSDQLYEYLQAAIRRGELVSGQRLVEDSIAGATSVSRTPVREALRKLVDAGLAVRGRRGLVVARLNSHELQQLWEVNVSLWRTVGKLAVARATRADIAEMTHLVEAAGKTGAREFDQVQLNQRFRASLLRAAGNQFLSDLVMRVVDHAESLLDLTLARRSTDLMVGEVAILEALEARDVDAMRSALEAHLGALLEAALIQMHALPD